MEPVVVVLGAVVILGLLLVAHHLIGGPHQ